MLFSFKDVSLASPTASRTLIGHLKLREMGGGGGGGGGGDALSAKRTQCFKATTKSPSLTFLHLSM